MPKYGGPGTLKKPCKKRKCFNPNVSIKAAMSSNKGLKSSKSLAPIFMKKKDLDVEVLEVTLSPSKLKARNDFLQSGVPETIKKKVLIEKKLEEEFNDASVFPTVSHVQQKDNDHWVWNLAHQKVKNILDESIVLEDVVSQSQSLFLSPLSEAEATEDILPQQPHLMDTKTLCSTLSGIKKRNPNFPVFAVFKSYLDQKKEAVESYEKELEKDIKTKTVDIVDLEDDDEEVGKGKRKRRSKGSPVNKKQKLSRSKGKRNSLDCAAENTNTVPIWQKWTPNAWTNMFAPNHSSQVIGNTDILRKMKVWLLEWKKQTESDIIKQKSGKKKNRREEDFLTSDESNGWEDDNELANTLLLAGPPGVGKTAAVYALAQELGYKVLEVNASSLRKGAQVMKQLAEATQSHSMSGGNSSQGTQGTPVKNPLAVMFATKEKKRVKEKKKKKDIVQREESQNSAVDKEKKTAMVLFEDIDIVFDEYDDGFIMAVNNIMAETKRPIILTTTYLSPNVLTKIKGNFDYFTFTSPSNDLVCQHLELMALSGGVTACPEDLYWLVEHCRGDIRQAISILQSWLLTGSSHTMCVNGAEYKQKSHGHNTEEWKCNVKEITLKEVFPDTKETLLREVQIQRGSLFGHLPRNICNSNDMNTVYKLPWTKLFINLTQLLPFHSIEKVIEKKKYPLDPESVEVKTSVIYQKQNWLSFDDESDDEKPKSEEEKQVSQNTEEETKESKTDVKPDVIKSSKLSLESMSTLSNTLCDLDILNSIPEMDGLVSRESGFEWQSWRPTPGLSDGYCTDQDWASQSFVTDFSSYLSCRAFDQCTRQVTEALTATSTPDHPQLCISMEKTKCKSLSLLSREPQIDRSIKHLERLSSIIPITGQQNKANLGCDYFPVLRQIARIDELGAALSHKRRGRRFLSYLSLLGFHSEPSEKITMANTFMD
ncbi:unnamed protein product [Meganyctiphanes norvegica]|uniref:AAA+ ATPase domain-containing protein n=1 Tax=Meganyctiphanes norvegica TaxID=48144 RepID=A0AAV2Q3P3_MEGNR